MNNITKTYSNGDITITWKPSRCIHSGKCFRELSEVLMRRRPWITPENSTTEKIIEQVEKCPSAALMVSRNHEP